MKTRRKLGVDWLGRRARPSWCFRSQTGTISTLDTPFRWWKVSRKREFRDGSRTRNRFQSRRRPQCGTEIRSHPLRCARRACLLWRRVRLCGIARRSGETERVRCSSRSERSTKTSRSVASRTESLRKTPQSIVHSHRIQPRWRWTHMLLGGSESMWERCTKS